MESDPVSVFLPVRNAERWIRDCLASLHHQEMRPCEILVADDASTDGTVEAILGFGSDLVRLERFPSPVGISVATNHLLSMARGRFLARMDADDICHPSRFRVQVETFGKSDVAVLGTWARRFGSSREVHRFPERHDDILAALAIASPFANPTVMFDRQRLPRLPLLDPNLRYAADYALFASLRSEARMGNVPQILLDWRLHDRNVGSAPETKSIQLATVGRIRAGIWSDSDIRLDPRELDALERLVNLPLPELGDLPWIASSFRKALDSPREDRLWAPRHAIRRLGGRIWDYVCRVRAWGQPRALPLWWAGRRSLQLRPGPGTLAVIALKSMVRRAVVDPA